MYTTVAAALAALEAALAAYAEIAPTIEAAVAYLRKAGITDEDIAALKAQDRAASDNQQAAIDSRAAREGS
jgi:hypothetical protein